MADASQPIHEELVEHRGITLDVRVVPVKPSSTRLYTLFNHDGTIAGEQPIAQLLTPRTVVGDGGRRFLLLADAAERDRVDLSGFDGYALAS